jgi:hypothetical protein
MYKSTSYVALPPHSASPAAPAASALGQKAEAGTEAEQNGDSQPSKLLPATPPWCCN